MVRLGFYHEITRLTISSRRPVEEGGSAGRCGVNMHQ